MGSSHLREVALTLSRFLILTSNFGNLLIPILIKSALLSIEAPGLPTPISYLHRVFSACVGAQFIAPHLRKGAINRAPTPVPEKMGVGKKPPDFSCFEKDLSLW